VNDADKKAIAKLKGKQAQQEQEQEQEQEQPDAVDVSIDAVDVSIDAVDDETVINASIDEDEIVTDVADETDEPFIVNKTAAEYRELIVALIMARRSTILERADEESRKAAANSIGIAADKIVAKELENLVDLINSIPVLKQEGLTL
jgi:hypothetical protein